MNCPRTLCWALLLCAIEFSSSTSAQEWKAPTSMKKLANGLTVVGLRRSFGPNFWIVHAPSSRNVSGPMLRFWWLLAISKTKRCSPASIPFFGSWKPDGNAPPAPIASPAQSIEHAVFLVPRPSSVQTTLEFAAFAPKPGDPDYAAPRVANAIYGGTFSSRLTSNIREDKGYTYSPYAFVAPFNKAGELVTHADVRNEVTGPTLNEIEYELNRLATTSPTEEELLKAKRSLVGREALRLQNRDAMAGRLAGLWIDELTPEQIGRYGERVTATTAPEVNAAAKKYFPAFRTLIVAVGEEKVVRDAVAPLGIPVKTLP